MKQDFQAYVLCGTPRSGSTLLCRMLSASGIAGRPHSLFREQDLREWADSFGLPPVLEIDSAEFDRAYLPAVRDYGTGDTGIFGVRIMWASVPDAVRRINRALGTAHNFAGAVEAAFGKTLYIHVSRKDVLAQAVSLARAEQSGLWHLNADGSVHEGPQRPNAVTYDAGRIGALLHELAAHDANWGRLFQKHDITPLRLVYEDVAQRPQEALATILSALGLDPDVADHVAVPTRKTADAESATWMQRYLAGQGN